MKRVILFFVKYPTPGKVKTRLAKTIGIEEAARIYRQLAHENYSILRSVKDVDLIVMFDPPEEEVDIKQWLIGANQYLPQIGNDLGQRLNQSFEWAFQGSYQKVIAVGSDILGLTEDIIQESFNVLNKADIVIGPALDGGYYLIGSRDHYAALFENITWSTPQVFQQTCKAVSDSNLSMKTLEFLDDLDEIKKGIKTA